MCVICVGVGADRPTVKQLEIACANNPDGFGWSLLVELESGHREIVSGKSMSAYQAITEFDSKFEDLKDSVVSSFFHARIATHGAVNIDGCHGFEVGGSGGASVMAHNGILPVTIAKGDWRSDSRVFAEDVLPEFGGVKGLESGHTFDVLDGFVEGAGSKVVILTTELDQGLIIMGERLGHWDGGLWWSNRSYEVSPRSAFGYYDFSTTKTAKSSYDVFTETDDSFFDIAPCCNDDCAEMIQWDSDFCEWCGWCQDCASDWADCLCLRAEVRS